MNILERIAAVKRREVEALKLRIPVETMRELASGVSRQVNPMAQSVMARPVGVIAEHKRRSPSKGEISPMSDVAVVAEEYAVNGAAAMSVLTDAPFFGGSIDDLAVARSVAPWLPILRKEFIVDEYQIFQARVFGADAILLIASMLDAEKIGRFNDLAHELGMQTLVELHSADELKKLPSSADMAGVNNRDLTSFSTDIENCLRLVESLPADMVRIAESGIKGPDDICRLRNAGFNGFLIGEALMKTSSPGDTLAEFIQKGSCN